MGTEPVDSVSVGKGGLVDEKETALVMPALRLAVVKDDQVIGSGKEVGTGRVI